MKREFPDIANKELLSQGNGLRESSEPRVVHVVIFTLNTNVLHFDVLYQRNPVCETSCYSLEDRLVFRFFSMDKRVAALVSTRTRSCSSLRT